MSEKTVVILQSNYIPWKGYFDLINLADEFIFYDDVQYTSGDWRNRNKIKTAEGVRWLSIPAGNHIKRQINEVTIGDQSWKEKHRQIITSNYVRAPYFDEYQFVLDFLYNNSITNLSEYNQAIIKFLCKVLNIETKFSNSYDYNISGDKIERVVGLLKGARATRFVCGPSIKNYMNEEVILKENIKFELFDYSGYPEYPQLYKNKGFVHEVTILDLLFNTGKEAKKYLKTFNRK